MIKGFDIKDLLEKAKVIQENMVNKKKEAAEKSVDISVGGGMVNAKMNGNLELLSLKLDPEIVDKDDIETLEDLVRSAVNEALRQAKELAPTGLGDMMSEMKLPDLGNLGDLMKK